MLNAGKRNVLGILIDATDYEAACDAIFRAAKTKQHLTVTALAVHGLMTGALDREQDAADAPARPGQRQESTRRRLKASRVGVSERLLIKGLTHVLPVRTRYKPDWNGLGSLVARYERRMHLYALRMRGIPDRRSISSFGSDINDRRSVADRAAAV